MIDHVTVGAHAEARGDETLRTGETAVTAVDPPQDDAVPCAGRRARRAHPTLDRREGHAARVAVRDAPRLQERRLVETLDLGFEARDGAIGHRRECRGAAAVFNAGDGAGAPFELEREDDLARGGYSSSRLT